MVLWRTRGELGEKMLPLVGQLAVGDRDRRYAKARPELRPREDVAAPISLVADDVEVGI